MNWGGEDGSKFVKCAEDKDEVLRPDVQAVRNFMGGLHVVVDFNVLEVFEWSEVS